jgi:transposase
MARSKNGQAISAARRTREELFRLTVLLETSRAAGDLETWRRAKAITDYIAGTKVVALTKSLDVGRSTINTWLRWYETLGADGLRTGKPTGAPPRLTPEQRTQLTTTIEAGPQAAGFTSGVWTGPMLREYIEQQFGVGYHNHHIPRLLHQLGFSVQRPRKRLARADAQKQAVWINERFPAIKKKPGPRVA